MSALEIVMVSVSSVLVFCIVFGFIGYRYYKQFVANKAKDFFVLDQYASKDDILFLGDSLTDFFDISEFVKNKNICNRGIAGDTTLNVLDRFDEVLSLKSQKAFLQIGINDIIYLRKLKSEELVARIMSIATRLRDNGTDVKIISLYPMNKKKTKFTWIVCRHANNHKVIVVNELLKEACSEQGFVFIDIHDQLLDEVGNLKKEYTIEGLHLSVEGYNVIYQNILPYIEEKAA